MIKQTWGCMVSALITTVSLALGLSNTAAKAEPEAKTPAKVSSATTSVLKVGETRSQSMARTQNDAIARIYTHQQGDRPAATVYVRNIPVLTFVGNTATPSVANSQFKLNDSAAFSTSSSQLKFNNSVKLPSTNEAEIIATSSDPIERATAAAALINQLGRNGFDAKTIVPAWDSGAYVIKFGNQATIKFERGVALPNGTEDIAEDAFQAANLLRRLMGNAEPVNAISNAPNVPKVPTVSLATRASQFLSGWASWYGPGFHGSPSASGEEFDENKLTAAHRSLPFGTKVRVTNMDNGQSVVVRINDRGPFEYDRVIDLSKAAAQVIGLITSGVAPVKLEVVGQVQFSAQQN